jgi:hypothetical protein
VANPKNLGQGIQGFVNFFERESKISSWQKIGFVSGY